MANNAPTIIWMAGEDKRRNFFNNTWSEFVGSGNGQNDSWENFIHSDDIERYLKEFEASFSARKIFSIEYRLKRFDGQYRWMIDQAKPNYFNTQQFLGYIGTSTELHDKKLLMQELDKIVKERTKELKVMNSALQRSNSGLQQFAHVASHDLQEPLRKILTYIDRIQNNNEKLSDAGGDFLTKITASARRMARLIDDLLDFSSLSHSKKFETVNLSKILEEVLAEMEISISEKKASVVYDKNLPSIHGDPVQLAQLFQNLISNGLKFTKENNPPSIRIN